MNSIAKSECLYEQIARNLGEQIRDGVYRVGDRLPSIRKLCARERVSVTSAMQAFSVLESRGLIEARPKSGYFVRRRRLDEIRPPSPSTCDLKPYAVGVSDIVAEVFRQTGDNSKVPLGAGVPASTLLPIDRVSRFLANAVREEPEFLGRYGSASGHPEFVRQLVRRFSLIGCHVSPGEVIATGGAMEALNLAIRAVTKPGDTVVVESPCYFGILEILESLGLKALPVPGTCEEGIDLELLAEAVERHPVKAVALVPTFNNPTGSCMSEERRQRLFDLLADHDLPLVEDDLYGDMHFEGERIRPIKALDRDGRVLYCGSFSKCLSPGLRVGWIAAGRYAERVERLKFITTITSPMINQIAIARFLDGGAMDRHLRALRRALHTQVSQIAECVLESFPQGTAVSQPKGGFFIWMQLPEGVDALALHREAGAAGIHIVPGQIFFPHADVRNRVRLSCGYPFEARIQQGIETLGRLVRKLQRESL